MKINAINTTNIYSFKAKSQPTAPLSQQQTAKLNFEKERNLAEKADSVDANPLTSLGYKLYRTFRFLSEHDNSKQQNLNVVA
jgi:hypothetical protein